MKKQKSAEEMKEYFENELNAVKDLLVINEANMKSLEGVPEGSLRVRKKKESYQYYFKSNGTDCEKYISTSRKNLIQKIAQLDYEMKANKTLKQRKNCLEKMIRNYEDSDIEQLYEKLGEGRKGLVKPLVTPTDEYVADWLEKHSGGKNNYPISKPIKTKRGEIVRSKSEKFIADMLYAKGIPYQYEPQLVLGRDNIYYPDFLVLNVRNRKTYIWEHLGLVDDEGYSSKNFKKILSYEKHGFLLGRDLIITMETENDVIDLKNVEDKIAEFLM
ncbi:hypothetical protein [Pseudobutyrivibrio xylanivorans]|uniref:Uncharacterized protein n=1 Tax=Pseudobutyrivibrio xylanivorans TaxID=185007 RepID=A0A5P6VSE7_PSEXY|nr:hypothetical protein [Pseudobutyrivibrio xylanivorans]QFJ55208.1 hypothetical protein FXF36_10205 [Pseudobutyrivibrio xylanivorans]